MGVYKLWLQPHLSWWNDIMLMFLLYCIFHHGNKVLFYIIFYSIINWIVGWWETFDPYLFMWNHYNRWLIASYFSCSSNTITWIPSPPSCQNGVRKLSNLVMNRSLTLSLPPWLTFCGEKATSDSTLAVRSSCCQPLRWGWPPWKNKQSSRIYVSVN